MKGVEIDFLMKVIEDRKLIIWQKIWDDLYHLKGVFIFSPIDALGSLSVNIVLEFNKETQDCSLIVISIGEGGVKGHLVKRVEESIKSEIVELAQKKEWSWKEVHLETTLIQCPHCLYRHSPFDLKIDEYEGSVCLNCGQDFQLDDVPEIDGTDYSGIECPTCGSVEDYKDYHVSWDRKVSCLNCGKTIVLEEATRHPIQSERDYFLDW
ncbi:MAG: hypothetical protein ACFFEL_16275 [Candidatus Thorarchaeota archaeon]